MSEHPSNAPLADGTDQPVVGGPHAFADLDREAYWHQRYVELKREYHELDLSLAAHRYALELQNTVVGLPPDNEKYDKVAELLIEARECLREMCDEVPIDIQWALANQDKWTRWRKVAGLDTANNAVTGSEASP